MKVIKFKFNIDDSVIDTDGQKGKIVKLIFCESGNQYEIKIKLDRSLLYGVRKELELIPD